MYAVASYQGGDISPALIHLLCTPVHGVSLISVYRNGLGGGWGAVGWGWGSGECVWPLSGNKESIDFALLVQYHLF